MSEYKRGNAFITALTMLLSGINPLNLKRFARHNKLLSLSNIYFIFILGTGLSLTSVSVQSGNFWTTNSPMHFNRFSPGVTSYNGRIYVIGGMSNWDVAVPHFEQYDPNTDSWTDMGTMPNARWGLAVTTFNDKIYSIGGYYGGGRYADTVNEYNPKTNVWRLRASLPRPAVQAVAATVNGRLFVFGSFDGAKKAVYEYDQNNNIWIPRKEMIHERYGHAGVGANGKIYAIGGWNPAEGDLSSAEEYDPETNTWHEIARLSKKRVFLAAAEINGNVFAIGGGPSDYNSYNPFSSVEEYDPSLNTWHPVASMSTARSSIAATALNDKIYVVGGYYRTNNFLSLVEEYTPEIAQNNCDSKVTAKVTTSGFIYSRSTKTYHSNVTVKNTGSQYVNGPVSVVFANLPTGVSLVNPSGTSLGSPYAVIPSLSAAPDVFAPNQSVSFPVQFNATAPINFSNTVCSGSLVP